MGSFFTRLLERLRGIKEVRLLMLGLDNAGKTSFNVECLVHRGVKFHVWDVGGQDKIRPLWRHYHTGTRALIFVIDSQDSDRLHEARLELHRILSARELATATLLVYANKQDLPHALDVNEIKDRLQLDRFPHRIWAVVGSCATSGDGLISGLNWLADNVRNAAELVARQGTLITDATTATAAAATTTTTTNTTTTAHACSFAQAQSPIMVTSTPPSPSASSSITHHQQVHAESELQ